MKKEDLQKYLATRRMGWPYEDTYHVVNMGGHRFVARIGDELAGLSYAELNNVGKADGKADIKADGRSAVMKMNLKSRYAEYGIGTELLELLMEDLQNSGFETIRYEIPRERYAFQIYRNLGFSVESQDEETVRFIWRKAILVTAFEPFGGETLNPTEMVLGMLPDVIGGFAIRKLLLPVEYSRSAEIAEAEYDRLRPAAVIMLGQAGGRSAITPETTAKNLMNSDQADNAGFLADHLRIDESRPDTLSSTLPIERIVDSLTTRGIRCEVSEDAGTFVCNSLFYSMLAHCSSTASVEIRTKTEVPSKTTTEVPTGFIHVPFVKEQGHTDKPFMELSDIRTAVEIIVETIIETVATAAALETAII